jgi:uncharacterized membrane protein
MTTLTLMRPSSFSSAQRSRRWFVALAGTAMTLCGLTVAQAQTRGVIPIIRVTPVKAPAPVIRPVFNQYHMTEVPLTTAAHMNESGMIVGSLDGMGAVYINGQVRLLSSPNGYTDVRAMAVSNNGIIVGTGLSAGARRPIIWNSYTGPAMDMGAIAQITYPLAVNSSGLVVGYTMASSNSLPRAYRWSTATGTIDMHPNGYALSTAYDVAESGFISGYTNGGQNEFYAARWYPSGAFGSIARGVGYHVRENGTVFGTGLHNEAIQWDVSNTPTLIGPDSSTHLVQEISRNGRMVGTANASTAWTRINNGAVTYLPTPAGTYGSAYDVNGCGSILGSYGTTTTNFRPVVWTKMTCDASALAQ